MNQDNFTQPPTPQQPLTPPVPTPEPLPQSQPQSEYQPQPQVVPEIQTQPVPAPELEPTSTPPAFAAVQPAAFPAATAPVVPAAPIVKSHKTLAMWTLITNLIYYCLPILVVLILVGIYIATATSGSGGADFFSMLIVYVVLIFGIGAIALLSGLAALILDIVYLVKAKPVGAKKVLTIVSLSLFGATFLGTIVQGVLSANFS